MADPRRTTLFYLWRKVSTLGSRDGLARRTSSDTDAHCDRPEIGPRFTPRDWLQKSVIAEAASPYFPIASRSSTIKLNSAIAT